MPFALKPLLETSHNRFTLKIYSDYAYASTLVIFNRNLDTDMRV